VIDKIGEGGMGSVYKGVDLMLEREVAIKVLKPELASQPQVVERFRSEAVTLAKLNHPNIATLYSFFRQGDHFFMVLEYVNGTPLEKIIEAHGTMTCEQAIPLFCQMLEGIDHAHSFGIVHRDIKPGNMMLTQNGLLKVLDFGIARALGSARMTRAGHLIGTIEYMSPEQVRGMETDARSDIYSLGMVLYEMLTGRVPFASDSEFELMKAQVEQLPTPPREFAPNIPEQVEWAILCATEKAPERRFQTAGAFSDAIINSVATAIATGELSKMDMRGSSSRLSAAVISRDLLTPRLSANSSAEFSTSTPPSNETGALSSGLDSIPPPTRFAPLVNTAQVAAGTIKPTRLGNASAYETGNVSSAGSLGQHLPVPVKGKFTRKHFILAGTAITLIFLGIVVTTTSVFMLSRSADVDGAETTKSSTSPAQGAASPTPETESQIQEELDVPERPASPQKESPGVSESNPLPVSDSETPKVNKPGRGNTTVRKKQPKSSKDIMGIP
jgi:serine/threonine-protein kinase